MSTKLGQEPIGTPFPRDIMKFPWSRPDIDPPDTLIIAIPSSEEAKKDLARNARATSWPIFTRNAKFNADHRRVFPVKISNPSQAMTKAVTASNARIGHLKYYNWYINVTEPKQKFGPMADIDTNIRNAMEEPIDIEGWDPKDPTVILLRDNLISQYQRKFESEFGPSNDHSVVDYSDLRSLTWDNESDTALVSSMETLLTWYTREKPTSEGAVENSVGAMLTGFFSTERTAKISNQSSKFPTALGCFGSHPSPDIASRMKFVYKGQPEWMKLFNPVIFVAEAKQKDKGPIPAQMACTLQPTFQIFAGWRIWKSEQDRKPKVEVKVTNPEGDQKKRGLDTKDEKLEKETRDDEKESTKEEKKNKDFDWNKINEDMPSWFWLGGISYTGDGIIFYGYLPVAPVPDDPNSFWKWVCWPITTEFKNIFETERSTKEPAKQYFTEKRLRLFKALFWMRQHTIYVAKKLTAEMDGLPDAYAEIGKIWDEKEI